ncbi:MAG: UDPGP type 1 family protein, partial [Lachnospiraceae bacterium]|nr:UDPGP type 1 family protein [Lachnospiraceae bacterium]
ETDFSMLTTKEREAGKVLTRGKIEPLEALQLDKIKEKEACFRKIGLQALKERKVGAVLLAGGMGTRLGSDDPKGMYDIGLTKHVYIFQRIMENTMDVVRECGEWIPFFVMTSDKNHEATTRFFEEHDYFGYPKEEILFFKQDMAPASDYDGKVYMESPYKMSTSPNGNGGWYISMDRAGITDMIHEKGIEWLNIFAVDNVLQRIADPVFVGAVLDTGSDVGSKVVRKASPDERVGVMCLEDGRPSIVEYYELSDEMRVAKNEKGEYAYNYGVILNYLFNVEALERIMNRNLPLHVVEKKINHIDADGNEVHPEAPNGYKYEQLVLDMIHELDTCLPFEVVREKEFAPIKNREGVDSVDTARDLLKKNGYEL